eukprot:9176875-Lingulodinium_polyedra.AAC.1
MKGHSQLAARLRDKNVTYAAARHAKRIMSDAYGRGVVRGAVEVCNLLTQSRPNNVVAAETIRTADTVKFFGQSIVAL